MEGCYENRGYSNWYVFLLLYVAGSFSLVSSNPKYDEYAILLRRSQCPHCVSVPHDPQDYPNIKAVATAGEPCPQGVYPAPLSLNLPHSGISSRR